ncbi:PQQ-dependent sugar dehydrogenase [Pontibacter sp. BT310]|uniref:PQQ-dependent sugar dehydrogenase n=1 Tax=Pontibacter populi TaxID=890055 RepID=A0ABS6XDK0_9BACT|nr:MULTISPECIES: PQQ-dependent sugar dehydrogenase [Pontibacter]MBJ6119118.1 PQQ-dependent sugar dehydrogenase [Pontibacter sp. BT310]MBR0571546.1 PQQ-dependent sugar dehydrogenase [Microvirga sp. STS03]MBW3365972.1 PQQ-dependent sugar dehydrogenase [Pontibacter populi]
MNNFYITAREPSAQAQLSESRDRTFRYPVRFNSTFFAGILLVFLAAFSVSQASAQSTSGLPAGFVEEPVGGEWNMAVGLKFSKDGKKMFVWEKAGKVWVVENGERGSKPMLDISDEVGDWGDHGLLGFEIDPNFDTNGFIYLLYVVDRNHLMNAGKSGYDPSKTSQNEATIGRVTRYTATLANGALTVNTSSRKVLLGATASTGIPITYISHGVGSLVFGEDGSLLVSAGDGATANGVDFGYFPNDPMNDTFVPQALADGIITSKEDVGAFRAQQIQSYNGKILRIDPATGNGLPTNPFYDASKPNAVASKVWALGLRNPFRFTIKPGTGSATSPGILYVGDVGWMDWEEISVVNKGGMNLGWPMFEGLMEQPSYFEKARVVMNPFVPNPKYSAANAGNSDMCKEFYTFGSLLKQARKTTQPEFLNPCDNSPIPDQYTFVHSRPEVDWVNDIEQNGVTPKAITRIGTFNGEDAATVGIGTAGSNVEGSPFYGSSSTGGIWYTGSDLPAAYKNTYFFGDYGAGWIKNAVFDANNKLTAIRNFIGKDATVTGFATNPVTGGLYYINYATKVIKISYYGGNLPPKAVAKADKLFGTSPLTVKFTGSESTDPENKALKYEWDFGDGSAKSTVANPEHTYTSSQIVTRDVVLKVTDVGGLTSIAKLTITLNNTPPVVKITSPAKGALYPLDKATTYNLKADVTDKEHSGDQLKYEWQTALYHNTHNHPEPIDTKKETTAIITPIGCDGETYFYRISLKVTDAGGLSATDFVDVYPDCSGGITKPIAIASPANNASYGIGQQIDLKVSFTDATRKWSKVVYYAGNTQIAESSTAPFNAKWTGATAGTYNITVQATDDGVHFQTSDAVRIAVGGSTQVELPNCLPGITHYFGFDEAAADAGFKDYASAAIANCTDCPEVITGKFHNALKFSAATRLNLNDASNFSWGASTPFSISFWMRTSSTVNRNSVIMGRNATESAMHWWIGTDDQGHAMFMLKDINHQGNFVGAKGPKVNDGKWHYITAIRDAGAKKNILYVDGAKVDEIDINYDNGFEGSPALNIGYLDLGDGYHFEGDLDEIKLYSRALTGADITEEFNGGNGKYCGTNPLGTGTDVNFKGRFDVYPNPTKGKQVALHVTTLKPNEKLTLLLTDATGRKVLETTVQANSAGLLEKTLSLSKVSAGFYNLTLYSTERSISRKLVVTD